MLKYEGLEYFTCGGRAVVTKQGTPVDGAHVFRNKDARHLFDAYRVRPYIDDCGVDDSGRIYFRFLNGVCEYYTRRQFITLAKRIAESYERIWAHACPQR